MKDEGGQYVFAERTTTSPCLKQMDQQIFILAQNPSRYRKVKLHHNSNNIDVYIKYIELKDEYPPLVQYTTGEYEI